MIELTRLNGEQFYVNADLIQFIEQAPDTVITLVNARKITVKEKPDAIIDSIVSYRQRLFPFVSEAQLRKLQQEQSE